MKVTPALLDVAADGYVPVAWVQSVTGRRHRTVRTWATTGRIRSRTSDGSLSVHAGDALRAHRHAARRYRPSLPQARQSA